MSKEHAVRLMALLVAAACCIAKGAIAVQATHGEMQLAKSWVGEHLSSVAQKPPFSFVYSGEPSSKLLPVWKREFSSRKAGKNRTNYVLTYTDPATSLSVKCTAVAYSDFPAVDWVMELTNNGKADTGMIESLQPLDVEVSGSGDEFVLHRALGESNSGSSFQPVSDVIGPNTRDELALAPDGGRSSDGSNMPFFNLDKHDGGVVIAIGWSGQWKASFKRSSASALRVRAGQELTHFVLHPGETVRTPRIVLVFWDGKDDIRGNNLFRQLLMAHYLPRRGGKLVMSPICASVNWTDPDGTYEKPHVEAAPILAKRGVEVLWSDMDPQQWYPIGFPEGTGTWEPDPAKYPNGLKPIGEAAHKAGIEYLLWFEPERVHPGSRIDKEHPEWVMKPDGEWSQLFRLGDPVARKWLTDYVDVQVSLAKLDWMRWDFNIGPLGFWRRDDTPDRQGIAEMRYIEGLYAMWDDLRARHPGLVIDMCASGGRRIDIEVLMRGVPLWHSDMQCFGPNPAADQLQNAGLFRWVPFHGCAAFGYEPSYLFRSAMTTGNILTAGHEDRLSAALPTTEADVIRSVKAFKKVRPYMIGDYYPLFAHVESEDTWFGYQFHRPDLNSGVAILFRRQNSADVTMKVELKGIDPEASYEVTFADSPGKTVVVGSELSRYVAKIDSAPGSAVLYYKRLKG